MDGLTIISPTLVKCGNLEGNLEPTLARFSREFRRIHAGQPNVFKYTLYSGEAPDPYWLILSQNQRQVPIGAHNSVLTLTSPDDATNQTVYRRFVEATGFQFKEADQAYARFAQQHFGKLYSELIINNGAGIQRLPRILT
jgi:hypothetical protein